MQPDARTLTAILAAMRDMGAQEASIEPTENGGFRVRTLPKRQPLAVSCDELATMLGVTPFLVADWAKKGVISSFKRGSTRFFPLPVVAHDIAKQIDLGERTDGRQAMEDLLLDWLMGRSPAHSV